MVSLLARLEGVLAGSEQLHPLDRFGRARFLEAQGFVPDAIAEYRRVWSGPWLERQSPISIKGAVGLRLARLLRRQGLWNEARTVLEECWHSQAYPYPAAIELAKLLEHQARDLRAAHRVVSDALRLLRLAVVSNLEWQDDLEQRLRRLDRRLGLDAAPKLALTG
jgi:hypothetical protein